MLSYKDANTGVFVGNSYRICTFGFSHIESPYSTTSACGNQIGTSPKTQSGDDAYCQGCSPSTKTVMYLSWIDDNVSEGSVILGWMRPNCAAVAQSLSYHCLCLDDDDCMNSYDKAFPSLRGAAVDFYFTLNDGYANTPSFNPLPTDQPPYLQLGQSFGQKHIGGQGGHQVVARFEQANAQEARALFNSLRLFIPLGHQGGV